MYKHTRVIRVGILSLFAGAALVALAFPLLSRATVALADAEPTPVATAQTPISTVAVASTAASTAVAPEPRVAAAPRPEAPRKPRLRPLGGGRVRSAREYFATLPKRFQPGESKGLHAIYQWNISSSTGGTPMAYHVEIDDGKMTMGKGHAERADVTIGVSAEDYVKIINGDLGGTGAVLLNKLKLGGSIGLARRLQKLFPAGHKATDSERAAEAQSKIE